MTGTTIAGLEAADPHCLRPGEAGALLAGHPWRRFAVLGDSIAEGVTEPYDGYSPLPLADRIHAELGEAVQPDVAYLNLGTRNLRTAAILASQTGPARDFAPDLAFVVTGANDAMRPGYESRADDVDRDLRALITALRETGALVVTMSVFVMPAYPGVPGWLEKDFIRRMGMLARRTTAIASALGTVHADLGTHPAAVAGGLTCGDGLHGNGRGQAIAAAEVIRRIGAYLGDRAPLPTAHRVQHAEREHHAV